MEIESQYLIPVTEETDAAEARRIITGLTTQLGFSETKIEQAAIMISEVATNLVKHSIGGEILLRRCRQGEIEGIEIIALDKGPGFSNLEECLRDGFSTAGSSGTGLGAIKRIADFFDIYSVIGKGTIVFAQLWSGNQPEPLRPVSIQIGGVSIPKTGEEECGDNWAAETFVDTSLILVADGLGHGPAAATASSKAVEIFREQRNKQPAEIIKSMHLALKSTRGAAASIVELIPGSNKIRYVGVGNVAGSIVGRDRFQHMVSHNGTLGMETRKIQEFNYTWPDDAVVILYSDGIQSQWNLDGYAGLLNRHPAMISAILYRDFTRGRDDVTVVVAKRMAA